MAYKIARELSSNVTTSPARTWLVPTKFPKIMHKNTLEKATGTRTLTMGPYAGKMSRYIFIGGKVGCNVMCESKTFRYVFMSTSTWMARTANGWRPSLTRRAGTQWQSWPSIHHGVMWFFSRNDNYLLVATHTDTPTCACHALWCTGSILLVWKHGVTLFHDPWSFLLCCEKEFSCLENHRLVSN